MDVYLLIQDIQMIVFPPLLCIAELRKRLLRLESSSSQIPTVGRISGLNAPSEGPVLHERRIVMAGFRVRCGRRVEAFFSRNLLELVESFLLLRREVTEMADKASLGCRCVCRWRPLLRGGHP